MVRASLPTQIWVKAASASYPIYVGENLLSNEQLSGCLSGRQVFIITNETIAPLYLPFLEQALNVDKINHCILPDGEEYKNIDSIQQICREMIKRNLHRSAIVVALGGGVVCDMSGFAASCYQRGVDFLMIPTTLLAQVDAAVGGKTGVNFAGEKNVLGTFSQPQAVFADITTLQSLPAREYSAGLAEVIKYALLGDRDFFAWLTKNMGALLNQDKNALIKTVSKCCGMKADIVSQDEREKGVRALLNLGHTFAHALESVTEFKRWMHGEAVAIGLHCAARLSSIMGMLSNKAIGDIVALIEAAKLPTRIPKEIDKTQLVKCMSRDKKNVLNQRRFILLDGIGKAVVTAISDERLIFKALESSSDV